MNAVSIAAYTGTGGVPTTTNWTYIANELPEKSFANFDGDAILTQIILPNSITAIWGGAFYNCKGLITITIPASVTYMMGGLFTGCTNLTEIHLRNPVPTPIDGSLGQNIDSLTGLNGQNVTLYVPIGAFGAYLGPTDAGGWGLMDFPNYTLEEEDISAVLEKSQDSFKVVKEGLNILISGLGIGNNINIYTIQGYVMYSTVVENESILVNLPMHGVYIIKIANQTVKIVL